MYVYDKLYYFSAKYNINATYAGLLSIPKWSNLQ